MSENNLATFRASWNGSNTKADGSTVIKLEVPTTEYEQIKDLPQDALERALLVSVFAEAQQLFGQ